MRCDKAWTPFNESGSGIISTDVVIREAVKIDLMCQAGNAWNERRKGMNKKVKRLVCMGQGMEGNMDNE